MSQDYIPDLLLEEVETLKQEGKYQEAMTIVNGLLQKNPISQTALLQVADIQYRQWEMGKAAKAIDFLNSKTDNKDPMGLYIKGVLEMEKNNRWEARIYLRQALEITEAKNHEVLRCCGLSEYRYWNREKWINLLKDAFSLCKKDPELICNLIQVYILEKEYKNAQQMIKYYNTNIERLEIIDKSPEYYEQKIDMFSEFLKITHKFTS